MDLVGVKEKGGRGGGDKKTIAVYNINVTNFEP